MPAITEVTISAFAHCSDVGCPGNAQQPVKGVRREVAETIGERGGDGPFVSVIEKSTMYVRFLCDGTIVEGEPEDDAPNDIPCPECGKDREITDQERPTSYGTAYGGPDALLRLRQIGGGNATRDSVMAAAQDAKSRPASAREQLDEAYVLGRLDEGEYQRKRAVLEGIAPESAQPRTRAKKTVED